MFIFTFDVTTLRLSTNGMYLFIDPSVHNELRLTLLFSDHEERISVAGKNRELLHVISETFQTRGIDFHEIMGILILLGQGGFSSTRIASVIGNAFAYALHIPIVGVESSEVITFEKIAALIAATRPGMYLSPTYSGEPTIGISSV